MTGNSASRTSTTVWRNKWLERHPTFKGREQEIRIVRGQWTLREGIRTEVITVSAIENEDIAGYDPAQDRYLYEYYLMAEAFGLDRKIEAYKGTRPITLYRWDLECLMDVIDCELGDPREYPDKTTPEYLALKSLGKWLREEYDRHYGDEWAAGPKSRV